MREDTPLRVSRRTEDTPKIHRRFTYAGSAPKRCIFIRRYTGSRSKRCIFTERVHSEDTRKRERQLLTELDGLGPPFEGSNGVWFRAGVWKGKPVALRMSSASSTGFENVIVQGGSKKRNNPFCAKFKPVGEKFQRHLPGSNSATAEEAAAKLAYYHEYGSELPPPAARQPRRRPEVRS